MIIFWKRNLNPTLIAMVERLTFRAPLEIAEVKKIVVISAYREAGLDYQTWIDSPFRGPDDVYPSHGGHITGNAVDLQWLDGNGHIHDCGQKIQTLAAEIGLRPGGRFKTPDPNHFDLGYDLCVAFADQLSRDGSLPWITFA